MKDCREEWYDPGLKVAVTLVDVTEAAQALARGHLCGPTSAYYLTKALAAAALLGAEIGEKDETVILQIECTAEGTLRGYTERKTLDAFDGLGAPKDAMVLGDRQIQITRSVPGRILSQGIATTLDGYLVGSLQRKACIYLEASVSDEVEILGARGALVEALPDSKALVSAFIPGKLSGASRAILARMGLGHAELRRTTPLRFACRCSPDRAVAMLGALSAEERRSLPPKLDITCHMCGKTFTVDTSRL